MIASTRHPATLTPLGDQGATIVPFDASREVLPLAIPHGAIVLHSIPSFETASGPIDRTAEILAALSPGPQRVVYLSTTGVYGRTRDVDETTPPDPVLPRENLRLAAEAAVTAGAWSSMVLRPAAIYGPGRGIHVSIARGDYRLPGDGANFVSRIHVDDLAAHCEAALMADLRGAWPVADEHPCTSREIAEYCAMLLGVPMPPSVPLEQLHHTRRANRRVDGSAVRSILGITLLYPSYRDGVPASLTT